MDNCSWLLKPYSPPCERLFQRNWRLVNLSVERKQVFQLLPLCLEIQKRVPRKTLYLQGYSQHLRHQHRSKQVIQDHQFHAHQAVGRADTIQGLLIVSFRFS